MQSEAIVYLARKLGWTLDRIGLLTPEQLNDLLAEVHYQEIVEDWKADLRAASIMATILNCTPRKDRKVYKATDFVGSFPKREGMKMEELARRKGLKVPKYRAVKED